MENKIKHVGVVQSVEGECVKVRISQMSACATCKVSNQCHTSESKDKIIDVYTNPGLFTPGDNVIVLASSRVGFISVVLGMLLPMLLLLAVLFSLIAIGYSELTASLASLASLLPYYLLLLVFRRQVNRKISFEIEKLDV